MPNKVYNNVLDHRLLFDRRVVEDITSVTLPNIEHPTTTFDAAGMTGSVDMPNDTKVNAMELTVAHNNGRNSQLLPATGKHKIEFRLVRQRYNVKKAEVEPELVKYRFTVVHKTTETGQVQRDNPLGYTERYTVLRYEEIVDGETIRLVDVMAGKLEINGVDNASVVQSMLK